jgi:hypothetical protein
MNISPNAMPGASSNIIISVVKRSRCTWIRTPLNMDGINSQALTLNNACNSLPSALWFNTDRKATVLRSGLFSVSLMLGCAYYNIKVKQTVCNTFQTKKTQTQQRAIEAVRVNKDYVRFTIAKNTPFYLWQMS